MIRLSMIIRKMVGLILNPRVLILMIGVHVVYLTLGIMRYPVAHIDVWSHWFAKSEIIQWCEEPISALAHEDLRAAHPQYPLLVPGISAMVSNAIDDQGYRATSFLWLALYLLSIMLSYLVLHKGLRFSSKQSLLLTYLYSGLPVLMEQGGRAHAGMADIWLTVVYWLALAAHLLPWFSTGVGARQFRDPRFLLLLALGLLAPQIKTEGVFFIVVAILLPLPVWQRVSIGVATIGSFATWQFTLWKLQITSSYSLQLYPVDVLATRAVEIIQAMGSELLLNLNHWYLIWWILGVGIVVYAFSKKVRKRVDSNSLLSRLITTGAILLSGYFLVYLFSPFEVSSHVSSSFDRVLLQVSPFILLISALLLRKKLTALEQFGYTES